LSNWLILQSELASEHIALMWPRARDQARESLKGWARKIDSIILCGCGDSHHAALSLEMALSIWTGLNIWASSAMKTARYLVPELGSNAGRTLVIGISASGEVARTLEAVESAHLVGAPTLAITGRQDSSLAHAAHMTISLAEPALPHGPGILGYISSLLMGLAVVDALAPSSAQHELGAAIEATPRLLEPWCKEQMDRGEGLANEVDRGAIVFLGSGPAYGSALFSAAKVVEAVGISAWGQDVEEWAHLEYFCEPDIMPTWLLSASGRAMSREAEILEAAHAIGRRIVISRWEGAVNWSPQAREALAPLGLWAGPAAFASHLADRLGEQPFRGFGGGRSPEEGGGASRIRSSQRVLPEKNRSAKTNHSKQN
jgi:glucosamine--fructose-6-phosphate aminotransferase (isomerizing)